MYYINKQTNTKVKVGDNINLKNVSEETLEALCKTGVLEKSDLLDFFFTSLKDIMGDDLVSKYKKLYSAAKDAFFSEIIMFMAKSLDCSFEGHIKDVDILYYIDIVRERICSVATENIDTKIAPFFRKYEDALLVLDIIKPLLHAEQKDYKYNI